MRKLTKRTAKPLKKRGKKVPAKHVEASARERFEQLLDDAVLGVGVKKK